MPSDVELEPMEWDFLSLVTGWNLYALPALLVLVAITVIIRHRNRPPAGLMMQPGDLLETGVEGQAASILARVGTLRHVALIHLGLAIRAGIGLVQELLTL